MIDVNKVAELARLKITEKEGQDYSNQLSAILKHFEMLEAVDTKDIEPMVTPSEIELSFREDNATEWSNAETALDQAPEKAGRLFKVPPVV